MGGYRALRPADWVLILCVAATATAWQLPVGTSVPSKLAGVVLIGGPALGIGMRAFEWYQGPS